MSKSEISQYVFTLDRYNIWNLWFFIKDFLENNYFLYLKEIEDFCKSNLEVNKKLFSGIIDDLKERKLV